MKARATGEPSGPWATGRARLSDTDPAAGRPLVVGARCRLADRLEPTMALLDTGARYSILGPTLAATIDRSIDRLGVRSVLDTRHGRIPFELARLDVTLVADHGVELVVASATVALPDTWPEHAPLVLGWSGFLERIRFALAHEDEQPWLWFGA